MKKSTRHHHHVGTSQSNLRPKPYGFCCDKKEYYPSPDVKTKLGSLFSRHNLTGEGPNIKFRFQEVDSILTSTQRLNQKSLQRLGLRGRSRGRQRGGYDDAYRKGGGGGVGGSGGGGGGGGTGSGSEGLREQYICKRCRGPLEWYIEDEIDDARDTMMQDRQKKYNAETERNIKIAKKKEKKKKKPKIDRGSNTSN